MNLKTTQSGNLSGCILGLSKGDCAFPTHYRLQYYLEKTNSSNCLLGQVSSYCCVPLHGRMDQCMSSWFQAMLYLHDFTWLTCTQEIFVDCFSSPHIAHTNTMYSTYGLDHWQMLLYLVNVLSSGLLFCIYTTWNGAQPSLHDLKRHPTNYQQFTYQCFMWITTNQLNRSKSKTKEVSKRSYISQSFEWRTEFVENLFNMGKL